MNNINVDNEKEISVNLTNKVNYLMSSNCLFFIGLLLSIFSIYKLLENLKILILIFSSILIGMLFLSLFFSSLSNFISYNYRDDKNKLYKNNKARCLFLRFGYIFLWSYLFLFVVFAMILFILH